MNLYLFYDPQILSFISYENQNSVTKNKDIFFPKRNKNQSEGFISIKNV